MALAAGNSVRGILKYFNAFESSESIPINNDFLRCLMAISSNRLPSSIEVSLSAFQIKNTILVSPLIDISRFNKRINVFDGNDKTGGKSLSSSSSSTLFSLSLL